MSLRIHRQVGSLRKVLSQQYRDFYLYFWLTGQLFNCCGSRDDCLCRRVVQTPSGGTGSPFRLCRYNSERHMMNKHIFAMAACLAVVATPVLATDFKVEEATIPELEQAFRDHRLSCHQLVQTYLDRIAAYNKQGPKLNAVLTPNGSALAAADHLDTAFAQGGAVGPLHCVPVVLKDNYNTSRLPPPGGSVSVEGARRDKDAFVVARLRAAGAIVLAKTNMHEFALAGTTVSSLGGQTLNPYDLTRTPGGSSGGTGVAVAVNLAMAGTGSDTVNSIRSPASANG